MKHLYNNPSLIQHKINALIWLWSDLDMCLEFIYELVLSMVSCYEDDFDEVKKYRMSYECNLTKLVISFTKITDISSISSLTNLTKLNLNGTNITNISILDHLKPKLHIWKLNLNGTNITNLSILDPLKPKYRIWK